jgi:hypothetical protein
LFAPGGAAVCYWAAKPCDCIRNADLMPNQFGVSAF